MFINRLLAKGPRFLIGVSAVSVCGIAAVTGFVVASDDEPKSSVLGGTITREPDPGARSEAEPVGSGFAIAGSAAGVLSPGTEEPIDLEFTNPNDFDIVVDSVTVTVVPETSSSCSGTENFEVTQPFAGSISVPANATVEVSGATPSVQRPAVTMRNLPASQDECKQTTVSLAFSGTAIKP